MTPNTSTKEVQIIDGDLSGITLPRWRIDKDTGHFVHDYGDDVETLTVAILKVDRSRAMWPERYTEGNQALCRSHNLLWPEVRDPKLNSYGVKREGQLFCDGCPMAEWKEENGQRVKPRCAEGWNVLLLDLDTGIMGVLSLSRTRAKVGQLLESFWRSTHLRFPASLSTEKVKGASGQWYGVKFRRLDGFEEEARERLLGIAAQFQAVNLSAVSADDTQGYEGDSNGHGSSAPEDEIPF
jgi:hypothetical protein